MKGILIGLLIVLCLSMPAHALAVPGDINGDKLVSHSEVATDILDYLSATYLGQEVEHLEIAQIRDAAHIHIYYPRTIVDSAQRTVTLYKPIERAVVFNSETIETMRSIKADDTIVGVGKYTIADTLLFSQFADLPNVGSVWSPNYEQVLACNPDAVFLYGTISNSSCDTIQNKLIQSDPNITVIRMDCYLPSSYIEEVEELGYIFEKEDQTDDLIDFYEGIMDTIADRVDDIPQANRTKVYLECWDPYHTAGAGAGWDEKLELAGGSNIFHELSGYVDVDPESVAYRNPTVIIIISKSDGGYDTQDPSVLRAYRDNLIKRSVLANVSAVQNGTIYVMNNDIIGGVRHFIGIGYYAQWLYPAQFNDLDMEALHKQYLTEFQGLNGNTLVDNGVFIWPTG